MATYLGEYQIDNGDVQPVASTLYGTCTTAADTAAKVATCANFDHLITGVTVTIKFSVSNTASNPTLNVNSTGALPIMRYGTTPVGNDAATSWLAGAVVSLTYDGTNWVLNDWINTYQDYTVQGTF